MKKNHVWLAVVFGMGAYGYGFIEVLWRGFTHWSMCLTGGVCLAAFFVLEPHLREIPFLLRNLLGSGIITGLEFLVGIIVNLKLHWHVWDYSGHLFHLFGQICPLFSGCWFLLSIPAFGVCRLLRKQLETVSVLPAFRQSPLFLRSLGQHSGRIF